MLEVWRIPSRACGHEMVDEKKIVHVCSMEAMMNGRCFVHGGRNHCASPGCSATVNDTNFCSNFCSQRASKKEMVCEPVRSQIRSLACTVPGCVTITSVLDDTDASQFTCGNHPLPEPLSVTCSVSNCLERLPIQAGLDVFQYLCGVHAIVTAICNQCNKVCHKQIRNRKGQVFCSVACLVPPKPTPVQASSDLPEITCKRKGCTKKETIALRYCDFREVVQSWFCEDHHPAPRCNCCQSLCRHTFVDTSNERFCGMSCLYNSR